MKKKTTPDYIFEASWEVCNLVGGIYTVLSTKARTLQEKNKDKQIAKRLNRNLIIAQQIKMVTQLNLVPTIARKHLPATKQMVMLLKTVWEQ